MIASARCLLLLGAADFRHPHHPRSGGISIGTNTGNNKAGRWIQAKLQSGVEREHWMAESRLYQMFGVVVAAHDGLILRATRVDAMPDLAVHVVHDPPPAPWGTAEELYATPTREGYAEPDFHFFRLIDRYVIRIVGTGDVHVLDEAIVFFLQNRDHRFLVEIVLLGLAMAFWLERRGRSTLHGSAVSLNGAGVGFVAVGGMGKSSLAAYLTAHGDPLITEDLLAWSWSDGVPLAEPAVAQLRLWPEVAAQYVDDWETLAKPHPRFSKRKLPVGPDGIGELASRATPLQRIYVLQRTERPSFRPTVMRLTGGDALAELLTHSYLPEIAESFGWAARRLGQLAHLIGVTPVGALRYPGGTEQLPSVRAAILADLAS
jgi:hypothetical protein